MSDQRVEKGEEATLSQAVPDRSIDRISGQLHTRRLSDYQKDYLDYVQIIVTVRVKKYFPGF